MMGQTAGVLMAHAQMVQTDIAAVEREMEVELENVVSWSTSVFGVAVEETPHMAVLRDQLVMLQEELQACEPRVYTNV